MKEIKKYFLNDKQCKTKDDVLKIISHLAAEKGIVKKAHFFYKSLLIREKTNSTGMIDSIAIPHAISTKIISPSIIVVKLNKPIDDWETLDASKVLLVICLSMPKISEKGHLDVLAEIASKMISQEKRQKLLMAKTKKEIWQLL